MGGGVFNALFREDHGSLHKDSKEYESNMCLRTWRTSEVSNSRTNRSLSLKLHANILLYKKYCNGRAFYISNPWPRPPLWQQSIVGNSNFRNLCVAEAAPGGSGSRSYIFSSFYYTNLYQNVAALIRPSHVSWILRMAPDQIYVYIIMKFIIIISC